MSEAKGRWRSRRLAQLSSPFGSSLMMCLAFSLAFSLTQRGVSLSYADSSELSVSLGGSYSTASEARPSRVGLGAESFGALMGVALGVSPSLSVELSGAWHERAEERAVFTQPLSATSSLSLPCPPEISCASSALSLKTRRRVAQLALQWQPYDEVSPLMWAGLGAWRHERREAYEVLSLEEGRLRGASLPSMAWWGGLAQLGLGLTWRFHARLSLSCALSLSAQAALGRELSYPERLRAEGGLWLRYHRYVRLF